MVAFQFRTAVLPQKGLYQEPHDIRGADNVMFIVKTRVIEWKLKQNECIECIYCSKTKGRYCRERQDLPRLAKTLALDRLTTAGRNTKRLNDADNISGNES